MVSGIYGYFDLVKEEIVYVGQSVDIQDRHKQHLKPCRYDEQPFNKILQNNPNRYKFVALKTGDFSTDELNALETHYIAHYNTFYDPNKFNYMIGGGRSVFSDESKDKIRDTLTGYKHPLNARKNMCKSKNNTGYFNVHIQKRDDCRQGFIWKYRFTDGNPKRITIGSINLLDLKQKVLDKGLPWAVIDETKAKLTCKTYDYEYNKLE